MKILNPASEYTVSCDVSTRSDKLVMVKYMWIRSDKYLPDTTRVISLTGGTDGQIEDLVCIASITHYSNFPYLYFMQFESLTKPKLIKCVTLNRQCWAIEICILYIHVHIKCIIYRCKVLYIYGRYKR